MMCIKPGIVLALFLSIGCELASGAIVRQMTVEALIDQADYIAYARVLANRSYWDELTQTIWTETELLVLEQAKGNATRTFLIHEPGGVLGTHGVMVSGAPRFQMNQEVVAFLYRGAADRIRVLGLQQGVFNVILDPLQGGRVVQPSIAMPETVLSDSRGSTDWAAIRGGVHTLTDFLHAVRERARVR